jgi:peptidoglycan hydrolase-like protein with peptidoglycan-binding domain
MSHRTRVAFAWFSLGLLLPLFASAATVCPTLARGMSGSDVLALQKFLGTQYSGFDQYVTGYFGSMTEQAVKQWQGEHNLPQLGIVGPKTAAAMGLCRTASSGQAASTGTTGTTGQLSSPSQPIGGADTVSLIQSLLAQIKALQAQIAALTGGQQNTASATNANTNTNTNTQHDIPASCSFSGLAIASGSSVVAYQASLAASGSQCVSETRTCANGILSGSYQNSNCSVAVANTNTNTSANTNTNTQQNTPASCAWNGGAVASGTNVTAYQSASVAYGSQCVSEIRTCTNGTLSGSYANASCSVQAAASCTFSGQTIQNGASVTAYQSSSVTSPATCVSEIRACSNGTLSGSYTNASCAVGTAASCTFNGQTVASGASVTAYQSSSVAYGQICQQQIRTCSNSTLSGSYTNASCAVAAAACTYQGAQFTAGQTLSLPRAVDAYMASISCDGTQWYAPGWDQLHIPHGACQFVGTFSNQQVQDLGCNLDTGTTATACTPTSTNIAQPSSGSAPLTVTFQHTAGYYVNGFVFGDGSAVASAGVNVSSGYCTKHTYTAPGVYTANWIGFAPIYTVTVQ